MALLSLRACHQFGPPLESITIQLLLRRTTAGSRARITRPPKTRIELYRAILICDNQKVRQDNAFCWSWESFCIQLCRTERICVVFLTIDVAPYFNFTKYVNLIKPPRQVAALELFLIRGSKASMKPKESTLPPTSGESGWHRARRYMEDQRSWLLAEWSSLRLALTPKVLTSAYLASGDIHGGNTSSSFLQHEADALATSCLSK